MIQLQYSAKLMAHHAEIAAFGGAFLLLVFLNFFLDEGKDTHWFRWLERRLANLGKRSCDVRVYCPNCAYW